MDHKQHPRETTVSERDESIRIRWFRDKLVLEVEEDRRSLFETNAVLGPIDVSLLGIPFEVAKFDR